MNNPKSTLAQQIAQAAIAFEQRRTGNHVPKSVTVVLSEGTLVVTLHEASLRQEIKRITGMEVREATAEAAPWCRRSQPAP